MTKLIILLFPSIAFANWTAFPDDGFTYSTREVCEAKNGTCYELKNGIEKDTMMIVKEDYDDCVVVDVETGDIDCVKKQRDVLALDPVKKAAKDAAINAEKLKEQAKEKSIEDATKRLESLFKKLDSPMTAEEIRSAIKDILILQGFE